MLKSNSLITCIYLAVFIMMTFTYISNSINKYLFVFLLQSPNLRSYKVLHLTVFLSSVSLSCDTCYCCIIMLCYSSCTITMSKMYQSVWKSTCKCVQTGKHEHDLSALSIRKKCWSQWLAHAAHNALNVTMWFIHMLDKFLKEF